ncbi:MAG: glutamate racemase [Ignavibacteriae bacterium]|nr:MAG: glutamate racemase [Ignavibacteriota bacterium]
MNTAQPIGVFDSGIGGLTVVRALTHHLPHENIIYFGDTARVPYGPKSPQVVREYALQDTDVLLHHDVKLIVIACNTVSAVALDVVQKRAKVPVVGVILPGAEAAARATTNNRIGVIGTVGTIFSNAYTNAIRQIDPDISVFGQPCPLFVSLAEEGWINHKATELIAKEYLFPLTLEKIDTLVMGCTHYPILREVIGKVLHQSVTLIDSGEATALAVKNLLTEKAMNNPSTLKPNLQFFVSDVPHKFTEIGERFLGRKLGKVQRVSGFLS